MTVLDNLIFATAPPTVRNGLLVDIRTAVAATGLADEELISLTFDGNKLISFNYELQETRIFTFDNLGLPQLDVSDIEIAIAHRVNDTGVLATSSAARDQAIRDVETMACAAVDAIINFRADYVSPRMSIFQLLNEVDYDPNPSIAYDWGKPNDGGLYVLRMALISFQLPHCHC